MVYQEAGQPEAAEEAYRKSLAIEVRLGNVSGQADTLGQLGTLYSFGFGQLEESARFFRQAADKYAELPDQAGEGRARSSLAESLRKLGRLDEARVESYRAIECNAGFGHASTPWQTWAILSGIESDAGNSDAASEAHRKAIKCYLAYRRDGGENYDTEGKISLAVTEFLLAGEPANAESLLQQLVADPSLPNHGHTFVQILLTIVAGSRDRSLAETPDLDFGMATEILFLIEKLENHP
jgi:tetratricopeptide (TPR) repeat protein